MAFVNYLPSLAEGVSVNTASITGLADQSFLTGDGSVRFTLDFKSAVSAFANSLGFYKVKADGSIGDVHILFDNTLDVAAGERSVDLGAPANGERIGFFLIQDGFHNYGDLRGQSLLRGAGNDGPGGHGRQRARDPEEREAWARSPTPRSSIPPPRLNPNGANQVLSGVKPGGLELQIGFEDLPNATGDRDFQDVVIGIHVTGDGFLFT